MLPSISRTESGTCAREPRDARPLLRLCPTEDEERRNSSVWMAPLSDSLCSFLTGERESRGPEAGLAGWTAEPLPAFRLGIFIRLRQEPVDERASECGIDGRLESSGRRLAWGRGRHGAARIPLGTASTGAMSSLCSAGRDTRLYGRRDACRHLALVIAEDGAARRRTAGTEVGLPLRFRWSWHVYRGGHGTALQLSSR
jgi:hypothetical protein